MHLLLYQTHQKRSRWQAEFTAWVFGHTFVTLDSEPQPLCLSLTLRINIIRCISYLFSLSSAK